MKKEVEILAEKIRTSDEWSPEDLEALCEAANMGDEWKAADGDTVESVVYTAAEKLGVEIL